MALVKRSGSWGVVIYENGRKRWVGTRPTKPEALQLQAEAVSERRHPGSNITVARFAGEWLELYPRPKRSTEIAYQQSIQAFVTRWGHVRLKDLSRSELRKWAVEHPAGMATARAMLGDAFRDGLISHNPLSNMRLPSSRGRKDLVALTGEQVQQLVECAATVHGRYGEVVYGPMIQFAAYTGLRPGEMHGLRWADVDLSREIVRVERQFSPKANVFTSPKNGKTREVYLTPPAREAFERLEHTAHEEIFQTKNGKHFSGKVSHYYWDPVRTAFGDRTLDFYALRHHFGTMLARMGVGAPEIAQAMGHVDGGRLALTTYIHISAEESRAKIRQAFQAPPELKLVSKPDAVGG